MCIVAQVRDRKYEPHHEKTNFCICENKDADQLRGNLRSRGIVLSRYKIQEFYSPILGLARAYKDDAHERREIQTIECKRVQAITMYDIFVIEI